MANVTIPYNRALGFKKDILLFDYARNVIIRDPAGVVNAHAGLATERLLLEHTLARTLNGRRLVLHNYRGNVVPARFALLGIQNAIACPCNGASCACGGVHLWEDAIHQTPLRVIHDILARGDEVYSIQLDYSRNEGAASYRVDPADPSIEEKEIEWRRELDGRLTWKLRLQGEVTEDFHDHANTNHNPSGNTCISRDAIMTIRHKLLVRYSFCTRPHPVRDSSYDQVPVLLFGYPLFWTPGTAQADPYVFYQPRSLLSWLVDTWRGTRLQPPRVRLSRANYNNVSALYKPEYSFDQLLTAVSAYGRANPSVREGYPADIWARVVTGSLTYRNATLRDSIVARGFTMMPSMWQVLIPILITFLGYEYLRHKLFAKLRLPWVVLNLEIPRPLTTLYDYLPSFSMPQGEVDVVTPVATVGNSLKMMLRRVYMVNKEAYNNLNAIVPQRFDLAAKQVVDQGWVSYQVSEPQLSWYGVLFRSFIVFTPVMALLGLRWIYDTNLAALRQEEDDALALAHIEETVEERKHREEKMKEREPAPEQAESLPTLAEVDPKRGKEGERALVAEDKQVVVVVAEQDTSILPTGEESKAKPSVRIVAVVGTAEPQLVSPKVVATEAAPPKLPPRLVKSVPFTIYEKSTCVWKDQSHRPDASAQYGAPKKLRPGYFCFVGFRIDLAGRPVIPIAFGNNYINVVATLETRVLNDRPGSSDTVWTNAYKKWEECITKKVRAVPVDVVTWVNTCNPQKRTHYKKALAKLSLKYDKFGQVPPHIAKQHLNKETFVKEELLCFEYTPVSQVKPRNIMGASDVFQMFFGPWVKAIEDQFHKLFYFDKWRGPRNNSIWFKTSGINVKQLNDLINRATEVMPPAAVSRAEPDLDFIWMLACGDDNLTIVYSQNKGFRYFFSDFSKFDKTHTSGSLKAAKAFYTNVGIPKSVLSVWEKSSKEVKGRAVSEATVKFSCQYNLATGAPDTSLRNTVLGVIAGLEVLEQSSLQKKDDDEFFASEYLKFGLEAKCGMRKNMTAVDYLSGYFIDLVVDSKTQYFWIPKIGRALAKIGYSAKYTGPLTDEAVVKFAQTQLQSVAMCYIESYYPVIASLCRGVLKRFNNPKVQKLEQPYRLVCTGYSAERTRELEKMLTPRVAEFYGIGVESMYALCNLLESAPYPCEINHPALTAMFERDCPDWFCKE